MEKSSELTPEERAKITEIQDLLIDRYVALKSAIENGESRLCTNVRSIKILDTKREHRT